jgi:hypothetical protein
VTKRKQPITGTAQSVTGKKKGQQGQEPAPPAPVARTWAGPYVRRPLPARATAPLYWAYGSNLNVRQMRVRCPRAEKFERLYMADGALVFRGVADVEGREGSTVAGGLWKITADCERALDTYEGVGAGFYVKRYVTLRVAGEVQECLFYKMRERGIFPPSEMYLASIAEGYEDFGLDVDLLKAAVEQSWSDKDKTPDMRRRYRRKGQPSLARALREDAA